MQKSPQALRWGSNDKYWWRFTFSKNQYSTIGAYIQSGDEEEKSCFFLVSAFNRTIILRLPEIIKPHREWVPTGYYPWAKTPVDGYFEISPRQYGFTIFDSDYLSVFFGRQTDDSKTEQRWSCFLPWTSWRHVRYSLYDLEGKHFSDKEADRDTVPKLKFLVQDYDGEKVVATVHIEEREWRLGTGWFKWLSLFKKPKIRRSLSIEFSSGIGPRKDTWKGGTTGHSIDLLPGELHEAALKRYCEQESVRNRAPLKFLWQC